MKPFWIQSEAAVIRGESTPVPAALRIFNGKIERIEKRAPVNGETVTDLGKRTLLPGFVDTHVHLNEPGRTEWEGFETATRAALAGGVTTLVDMPLNSIPPTTTLSNLETKRKSVSPHAYCDYGFWGGIIPGNTSELEPMIQAGVLGFKAFLIDSGVKEFPMATEADLKKAMPILARHGVPLLVHAELDGPAPSQVRHSKKYSDYLASRPESWEISAIEMMIRLAKETGCRTHIVHLSAGGALEKIQKAKKEGVPLTVETCPHYLGLSAEAIEEGATHFKCAPPIREKSNQEKLWQGLKAGVIDFVVSDHSPCTPALKKMDAGTFDEAWGGIAGLQFSSRVVFTKMQERKLGVCHLADWMASGPAHFLGLKEKGVIAVGADADLAAWDLEEVFEVTPLKVLHRHSVTPYQGLKLKGGIHQTWLKGELVFDEGKFSKPLGKEVGAL